MKQFKLFFFTGVMIITFISIFISCDNENDDNKYLSEVDNIELKQFLKTHTAKTLFNNFKLELVFITIEQPKLIRNIRV